MTRGRAISAAIATLVVASVTTVVRAPARLVVRSDTLIVNGEDPVLVGARLLNRNGREIWRPGLRYVASPMTTARASSDGSVRCTAMGDAILTISRGALEKRVLVRCRPIAGFSFQGVSLELGGPPKELTVNPIGYDRRRVVLLRGQASIRDSGIAKLRGNLVYPVKVGYTLIDVDFSGGTSTRLGVSVTRPAVDASLKLVGGEMRTWRLPPGYYKLHLDASAASRGRASLLLAASRSNCARGRDGPQDYWCITSDSSTIVVRNPEAPGRGRELAGHLSVVQYPHS
jgi:hypothetical protein